MKDREATEHASAAASDAAQPKSPRKRRSFWRILGIVVLVLAVLLGVGRAILPWYIRHYVNRTLDRNVEYKGSIGTVRVHLWRGAYSIEDVTVSKRAGQVPVPLFAGKRVDFALEWKSLVHGKIVGRVLMQAPELNFVDAPTEDEAQTGAGGPWLQMIRDLFPFKINSAIIQDGSIHL